MAKGSLNVLSNPLILITFVAVLIFAVIVDVADLFMEFIGTLMVPPGGGLRGSIVKSILSAIDFIATLIIGGWSFFILKQGIPGGEGEVAKAEKSKETTKTAGKEVEKGGKKAVGKTAGQVTGKAASKVGRKVVRTVGLGLIGEVVPFVGAAPFWTIIVIQTFNNAGGGIFPKGFPRGIFLNK